MLKPIAAAALCAAVLPATAGAATFNVDAAAAPGSPDCRVAAQPCKTIADAITQSRAVNDGNDVIVVAAGHYGEVVALDQPADAGTAINGAGPGPDGTVIDPAAIPGSHIVRVGPAASGAAVRGLRVVHLAGAPSDKNLVSVAAPNTVVESVFADVQRPASVGFAFSVGGGPVTLSRVASQGVWNGSALNASPGEYDVRVLDARLTAGENQPAVSLASGVRGYIARSVLERPNATGVTVLASNAFLRMDSSLVLRGNVGVQVGAQGSATASGLLRNVTIDAGATLGAADQGIRALLVGASNTASASATLRSTIVVDSTYAERFQATATARLTCSDSDVEVKEQAPAGALGEIACGAGAGNVHSTAGALFVAPGNFHLRDGSPAIDTGSRAALEPDESAFDLDGRPRILDGPADVGKVRDRGAYERPEAVRAVEPPRDTKPPVLTRVSLASKRFKAAKGTTLRLTSDESARLNIEISRAVVGRRVGTKCLANTKARRKRRKCTRYALVVTPKPLVKPGASRLAFPGQRLSPGRYRARLKARDIIGNFGPVRTFFFTVVR